MHYGASISMLDGQGLVWENDMDLMALICFWCVVNARKRHPEDVKSRHILNTSTYQAITLESTEVFVAPGFDGLAEKNPLQWRLLSLCQGTNLSSSRLLINKGHIL
ncbi:hypothetical protein C5167_031969 [Papaver somniferum]|uniref:Uncharacterized protein n=1 Tax=Papaver somniferum TaxID=3469 RepID=A0A4Y7KA82_PAPSO|nr:hypothetical protein C5167_031969 [Papaver somniferum]